MMMMMMYFNLILFIFFFTNLNFYSSLATQIDRNPFFKRFERLNYDLSELNAKHSRVQRSLVDHLTLSFDGYNRKFRLKLYPKYQNYFDHDFIEINHDANANQIDLVPTSSLVIYEGELTNEPKESSFVSGSIIDGQFIGVISSTKHGKYFVEPLAKYDSSQSANHSIIYHEDDINSDLIDKHQENENENQNDDQIKTTTIGCGARHEKVREEMEKMQTNFKLDPKSTKSTFNWRQLMQRQQEMSNEEERSSPFYKYSLKANFLNNDTTTTATNIPMHKRFKRQSGNRLQFPDNNQRSTCNLFLKVDPTLYTLVFNNEGKKDATLTSSYLLFFLNQQVSALNSIYNPILFYDSTRTNYYTGVNFRISRSKIYTQNDCASSTKLSAAEKNICTNYLDVTTYLNYVSLDDYSNYCLGFAFSARDFADGSLGLAWVASTSPTAAGGICQKPVTIQGQLKSLNTGISTLISYSSRVPTVVAQLTFAHEVGHSFGSAHDPDANRACTPGDSSGGNYIMYSHSSSGTRANNNKFSSCSQSQMGSLINFLASSSKFCFISQTASICGNNIVESGESCDCGFADSCTDSCCYPAGSANGLGCTLRPGAVCSPSAGPCCTSSCTYASSSFICLTSSDCMADTYCTGSSSTCPSNLSTVFKANFTECNKGSQVCISGSCTGSICLKYGLNECSLTGDLLSKSTDLTTLCHVACNGTLTNNRCVDSFNIPFILSQNNNKGYFLKSGSPCGNSFGYCDAFSKCRYFNASGPLSKLTKFLIAPDETLNSITSWLQSYWWVVVILMILFLILVGLFVFVMIKIVPSTNPKHQQKNPNISFRKAIRHPALLFKTNSKKKQSTLTSTTSASSSTRIEKM